MRFNLRVQSKWCQSPSDTSWLINTPFDPEIKSNACQTINNWNCIKGLFQGWPVHFVYKAIYESLFAMELEKLLVNDRVTASCQTNWSRSQVCYDGDDNDNENVKRAIGWIGKATPLHVQHGFFVHFFAVTARLRRENALFHVLWGTKFMSCDGPYALHHMVDIACWEYCIPNNTLSQAVNRGIINISWPFPVYSFINSLFQAFR